jgi:hypothetical protein
MLCSISVTCAYYFFITSENALVVVAIDTVLLHWFFSGVLQLLSVDQSVMA